MKKAVWYVFALIPFFFGCSPTKIESEIPSNPIPNSQIGIMGYAQVHSPAQSGKATYNVQCMIMYADSGKSNSDFNSAVVTVNGVRLARTYNGTFQNVNDTMRFSEGDSLQFVIKDQKVGTVKETVYVPPSVINYSISPSLPVQTFQNSNTSFFLSWTPVNASFCSVEAVGYNIWETIPLAQFGHSTLLDTMTVVLQDSIGNACPYLAFLVQSYNGLALGGFAPGSGFEVSGSYYKVYSNMPGVGSNIRQYGIVSAPLSRNILSVGNLTRIR